MQYAGHVRAAG
jgi:hypothetical protein